MRFTYTWQVHQASVFYTQLGDAPPTLRAALVATMAENLSVSTLGPPIFNVQSH